MFTVSTKFTYLKNFLQMTISFINITSPPWSLVQVHQTSSSASSSSRALLRQRLSCILYSSLLRYLGSASRQPDHQVGLWRRAIWNSSFNVEPTTMTNAIRPPSWPRSASQPLPRVPNPSQERDGLLHRLLRLRLDLVEQVHSISPSS